MKQEKNKSPPRFLLKHCNDVGQVIDLNDNLMHYASRVLRLRDQDTLRIWNGHGCDYLGTIHYVSKKLAQVRIEQILETRNTELNRAVHIVQALPDSDKMDWILEKCTELGAVRFHPVQAQRCVVKLDSERAGKKQAHWERVVLAASLQSNRSQLALVETVKTLPETLAHIEQNWPNAQALWFNPRAEISLQQWVKSAETTAPLIICVGPEGGWTAEETSLATNWGAKPLRFSQRILRTETFGLACVAQLTALLNLEPE